MPYSHRNVVSSCAELLRQPAEPLSNRALSSEWAKLASILVEQHESRNDQPGRCEFAEKSVVYEAMVLDDPASQTTRYRRSALDYFGDTLLPAVEKHGKAGQLPAYLDPTGLVVVGPNWLQAELTCGAVGFMPNMLVSVPGSLEAHYRHGVCVHARVPRQALSGPDSAALLASEPLASLSPLNVYAFHSPAGKWCMVDRQSKWAQRLPEWCEIPSGLIPYLDCPREYDGVYLYATPHDARMDLQTASLRFIAWVRQQRG